MNSLYCTSFSSKLGEMVAVATEKELLFLEFSNDPLLENSLKKIQGKTNASTIHRKTTPLLEKAQEQIRHYFEHGFSPFTVPLFLLGTSFQVNIWKNLLLIPYGKTSSYSDVASSRAYRAIGHAIALNRIAIIIPCHRVIYKNGKTGNYRWGEKRKQWLLDHERNALTPK
jgi:AraC family transcriptional regulator, regulatory protein of adaptative response / methylated-DNA-[protein]-cysteine methyltransferase